MPPTHPTTPTDRPARVAVGEFALEAGDGKALADAVLRAGYRPTDSLEEADVFVGVFGEPAGAAERDYTHAVGRDLPRLVFLAADAPPSAFTDRLRAENACESFASMNELRALVTQGLLELRDRRPVGADAPVVVTAVPRPPEFYTAPPYLLQGSRFVGRRTELAALDEWAVSNDRTMVVEAIGGMGKSALTWEWVQRHAVECIPNLAGRVWWSFYERGTSMKTFLRHALAYVTGRDPDSFPRVPTTELGDQLLAELRAKPYLLVLDGFERVLTAYHRSDKAQLRDDRIPVDARECTNPRDGEVLRQLLACSPSRILVSSRLMPAALEGRAGPALPSVRHMVLGGLASADALEMASAAGVTGTERAILDFADQFDRHPLLLRVACGLIADYAPGPGDFDAWAADPAAGGALKLSELAAKQRYTFLMEYAFRALGEKTRQLLSRIAVLSDAADYATVAVLNPFIPPPPAPAPEPQDPAYFLDNYEYQIAVETNPARQARLIAERDRMRTQMMADYRDQCHAYERYRAAERAYPVSPEYRKGVADFHAALAELEDRGLLQWDRTANSYDLHPVVRAYAFDLLEEGERVRAFSAIGDHFASRPPEDPQVATELSHLRNSIEIVRAFTGAGRGAEAAQFLRGRLSEALLFTVGAHHALIELLVPLLGETRTGVPLLTYWRDRSYTANNLALALTSVGRVRDAKELYLEAARLDLEAGDLFNLETGLRSLARCVQRGNELHLATRILELARTLAAATRDQAGITGGILDRLALAVTLGQYAEAEKLFVEFRARPELPRHMYRPGAAEYHIALARFYQGKLGAGDLAGGARIAEEGRGVQHQHLFAALRAEWELAHGNADAALEAAETALSIVRRTGESASDYLGLRAHALARLGRPDDARAAIAEGVRNWDGLLPRFPFHAAEASRVLGDTDVTRDFLLQAQRRAWADGPPYTHPYYLERCRARMAELNLPEPGLLAVSAANAAPVPLEAEIRAAIKGVRARK